MSEMEELKKNTEKQKIYQIHEKIGAYLDIVTEQIKYNTKRETDAWRIYLIAWLSLVIVSFISTDTMSDVFQMITFLSVLYACFRTTKTQKSYSEFFGAIEILRILGMIPPTGGDRGVKRSRFWEQGLNIVKNWGFKKKNIQQKAYGSA